MTDELASILAMQRQHELHGWYAAADSCYPLSVLPIPSIPRVIPRIQAYFLQASERRTKYASYRKMGDVVGLGCRKHPCSLFQDPSCTLTANRALSTTCLKFTTLRPSRVYYPSFYIPSSTIEKYYFATHYMLQEHDA